MTFSIGLSDDEERPDNGLIGPPMPVEFYRHLPDDNLAAIIACMHASPAVDP